SDLRMPGGICRIRIPVHQIIRALVDGVPENGVAGDVIGDGKDIEKAAMLAKLRLLGGEGAPGAIDGAHEEAVARGRRIEPVAGDGLHEIRLRIYGGQRLVVRINGGGAGGLVAAGAEPDQAENGKKGAGDGKESGDGLGHSGERLPLLRRVVSSVRMIFGGAQILPHEVQSEKTNPPQRQLPPRELRLKDGNPDRGAPLIFSNDLGAVTVPVLQFAVAPFTPW